MINCLKFPLKFKKASVIVLISITLGGLAGCGGGSAAVAVAPPPLVGGAAPTTGSTVLSWFAQIAESLYDVAKGVASIAEGNVAAGVSEFAAAGLGLISKGLESGDSADSQAKQLTDIDGKLDTLIVDVQSIAGQLTTVEGQVANLADYDMNSATMAKQMADAQTWLDTYYTNPSKTLKSRAWVHWETAGCDAQPTACTTLPYPAATAATLAAFRSAYMRNPAQSPMKNNTDNFPLWWAYSVIGDQTTGAATYIVDGNQADTIVTQIYEGITNNAGQDTNGLLSYMHYVMTQSTSHCAADVTDPQCDLFKNVYTPLEAYFSLAIGRQSQLVMALAEADTVLAQNDPLGYQYAGRDLMADFNQNLNAEVEVFLQVAEQIALYRAADGRTDWSNFANTDAGKLLARADFIAAQLAGKNYRTVTTTPALVTGYINPPWPSSGIVGRVFYANGEQMLTGPATRAVCSSANIQSCTSTSALTQIGEIATPARTVNGGQPYLVWKSTVDAKTGAVTLMTGTANTLWSVQRLSPMAASALTVDANYWVNSTKPTARMPAQLAFNNYDENFATPPQPNTSSVIPFGSFSSVEGAIGNYGLKLDTNSFAAGTVTMPSAVYSPSYSVSATVPGAVNYNVTYSPNKSYNSGTWGGVGTTQGTWSASTPVVVTGIGPDYPNVKLSWTSTLGVNLNSAYQYTSGLGGNGAGRNEYYSYVKLTQQVLDGKGNQLPSALAENADCFSAPFEACKINNDQSINVSVLTATAANLTFKASFATEVDQYNKRLDFFNWYETVRTSIAPSVAAWEIQAPLLTLTK